MSYSRWIGSVWYTFWCAAPRAAAENRENALFEVCAVKQFTAEQLRKDLDACAQECVEKDDATPEEGEELKSYMRYFLADVDKEYPA